MSVSALSAKSFHQEMVKSKSVLAVFQALRAVNEKVDPYPIYLTFAGFVIQLLQYVGFAFGPIFVYTYLLADEASYFVYLWSGPLFDRNYGSLSYSVYSALVCVFAALLAGSIGISVVAIIVPSFLEHKRFINILRAVLESIGGWLYIPLLHLFLGGMSCHNGSISSFPDETCGQTLRYVNIAVGILGILCTCVIAVAMCWVYDLSGDSQHLLGRAHGYFDLVFVLAKTVLCVFLHILIPQDEPTVFAFLVVAVSLLLFGLLVVVMPFYKNQTSAIFCAIFTITAFLALLNAFENINVKYFKTSSCSARCFLALSLAPFVGLLGYACATIRVNPDFQNRIGTLQMFGISSEHVARFPLPRTFTIRDLGLVSPGLRAVDKDLIQEMTIEETSPNSNSVTGDVPMTEEPLPEEDELAVMRKHRAEFFVPYLQMMHLPTDAEVATRFLRAFKIKTGGAVKFPAGQLNYALRMYFKAVVYFKQSGYVTVCLGWFLYEYCNRTAAVVELLNDMERRRHVSNDYVIMFKAFRLAVSAKEALGYRDATHLLSLQRARVHHRQVLATTVSFWDALLQERDRVTLIMINDELSYQRHAAMAEYRLALSTSQDDRSTLYSISEFVEDVFNEKEIAHELRVSIDEIELQKKSRMLRGAQPKSRQKISHLDFDDILSAIQIDTVATNSTHKFEKRVFLGLLYLAVVLSWLASASMLILAVIMMKHAERSRNAVHEIKNTAANGYLVIYLTEVLGIFSLTNSCTTNTSCGSDASYLDLLQNISAAEMAMRISHNLATYGKYGPSFGASPYKYVTEGLLPVGFYPSGADFTAGTFSCSGCSASRLYQKLLSTLNMDSDPMPEWIASSTVSAYVTTMVNRMQHSMTYDHYMQFITDGGAEVFLKGSDVYANVTVSNVTDIKNSIVVGLIVSVLVLVLAVGFGVTVFFVNLEWMAKGRVLVVGLFTVIPVLFLQQLRDQTQNRLDAFEVSGDSRETDMQLGLQESDDDDVMDHTVEEMSPDNLATHNSHIPTLLQMKPHRSCFKQLNSMVLDVSGRHKSVRFQLTQRDLADRPKQRLLEPKLAVDQEGKDIVADFEKSLAEIDSEMKEETQNERQRRDTNTEHRVNTSYRVQWSRIKSRLSAWNTSIPLFQLLFSGVLIPLLLITSIVAVVLSGMLHHSNAKVLPTEQSSLNELTTLYTYVSAFQRFDIDVSVFCNFFYVTASDSIAAYAFQSQRYKYLIRRLQEQSDVSILEIVPNAVTLSTMILRPVVTDIIYAVLAARAASALNEYNLSAQPYFATFSYGEGESNSVSLSNVYPSAFELPQQYEIPALENFSDDATTMLEQVQSMHRRARFYADETNIQNSLMGAATQALDTMMETLNGYKKTSIGYFIGVFVCVAAVIVGCGVGIILAYKFNHSRAVRIFLSVALAFALVTLIMAIVAYEYQFWKKLDASEAFSSVGTITEYQTQQFLRLTYIEQYINSPTYATLHAIYPSISGGSSSASSDLTGLAADYATIQDVAMFLAYAGRAKIANPAAPIDQLTPGAPFISSYNYASEPNYLQDSMTYANDHPTLMYSNPQADLTAHTGEELLQMARFAVFGLRGSTYYTNLMDSIESTFTTVASDYSSKMKSGDDKELGLLIATIILACLVVVCLLGATAHPLVLLVISMAEGKNSKLVRATMTVSYWELFRLVIIAASCCVAFGVVQFVLILVPLPTSREASDITLHSSARIEEIQHSMATALYGYHAVYAQSAALAITAFSQLSKSISVLQSCREFLYYSSTASSGGYAHIASLNDDQRNLLFTATTTGGMSMDKVYMNWIATLQQLANFQPEMYISTPVPTAPAKNLYSITDDQQQQISDALDTLQSMYYDLLNVLEESSSLYSNSISSAVHKSLAPAIIFFILSAGGGVIAMVYILPSLSRRMSKEEEEIGLLLKTIPKAVHDAVPSISLYVGSGQLDEDAEDAKSRFTLSPQAKEFLEQWQQTEPQDAGMEIFRVLEICPHGVVVTDDVGTILFANTALLEMMHHDTLKGKSISVMMEPTIAEVHGELMARYIRNPRPTGPQTLDVMAYTKDGEALHVVNVLGDAPSRSRQRYFISEIHRFSAHGSTRDRKRRSSNPVKDSKN